MHLTETSFPKLTKFENMNYVNFCYFIFAFACALREQALQKWDRETEREIGDRFMTFEVFVYRIKIDEIDNMQLGV